MKDNIQKVLSDKSSMSNKESLIDEFIVVDFSFLDSSYNIHEIPELKLQVVRKCYNFIIIILTSFRMTLKLILYGVN